mgnify:CR=1 FL=1
MTLFTTDYLEYYLTLLSWVIHNGIWAVLVSSGVFAIPFVAIIIQEWLRARAEGADEGNKGALSSLRIENRVWVAIVVVMFAGIPFIDVDLNTIKYDQARSAQCQVSVPEPGETGWSQSFSTLNNQSARVPVWWAFMHALSRAITGASVAAIPCGTDLRQIRMEINATRIDDPVLAQEVADFTHDCYGPARAKLFMNRPNLDEAQMHDVIADGDQRKMVRLNAVDIAPGESLVFEPGGRHIMLLGITDAPEEGGDLALCAVSARGTEACTRAPVTRQSPGETEPHGHHH